MSEEILNQEAESPAVEEDQLQESQVEETVEVSEDEAIEIANDTEYGLAGYVQSGDEDHAKQVARRIRAGQISINGGSRGPAAPFGGFKTSGNGREHGLAGLSECLETKAIIGN